MNAHRGLAILYLVRHGKAEGSHPEGDRFRSLSAEGLARIAAMGPAAVGRGFRADLALSSPYRRAVQTLERFEPFAGPWRSETASTLSPEADPREALAELAEWEAEGFTRVAVFTHNPFVTHLAGLLVAPGEERELVFHTPTIVALGFERGLEPHAGRILWTLHP